MIYIGMDVHQSSTAFCCFDPAAEEGRQYRTLTRPTTAESFQEVLRPFEGRCRAAFEVGTQAQWIAGIVRPLVGKVQVANPSRIPWVFRDGRKNDRLEARKPATLPYLGQLPTVHLPRAEVSAWRALIAHRQALIRRGTMIKIQIHAIRQAFGRGGPHRSCVDRVRSRFKGRSAGGQSPSSRIGPAVDDVAGARPNMKNGPSPQESHVPPPVGLAPAAGEHERKLGQNVRRRAALDTTTLMEVRRSPPFLR